MRLHGVPIPADIITSQKDYVACHIIEDERHGVDPDPRAIAFAGERMKMMRVNSMAPELGGGPELGEVVRVTLRLRPPA